eukprot:TRINITY_DN6065_c1_g1_i1.p1 TRINITY_DN6065_c1_g1~~TRINITY_DN6065_c1_g1_i1.p1  ORF type:complete len:446 (+),score=41.37 TRINITY_DN6065_c1_g1_i1:65-1402(+)
MNGFVLPKPGFVQINADDDITTVAADRGWRHHLQAFLISSWVAGITSGGCWVTTIEEGRKQGLDQSQLSIIMCGYFWGAIVVKPIQNLFSQPTALRTALRLCQLSFTGMCLSLVATAFAIDSSQATLFTTLSRALLGCSHSLLLTSATSLSLSQPSGFFTGYNFKFAATGLFGSFVGLLALGGLSSITSYKTALIGLSILTFLVAVAFFVVEFKLPGYLKNCEGMGQVTDPIAVSYSRKMTVWIAVGVCLASFFICSISFKIVPFMSDAYDMTVLEISLVLSCAFPLCFCMGYVLCQVQGIVDGAVEDVYPNPNYFIYSCVVGVLNCVAYFRHDTVSGDMHLISVLLLSVSLLSATVSFSCILITSWPLLLLTASRNRASLTLFFASLSGAASSAAIDSVSLFTTFLAAGSAHLAYGIVSFIVLRNFFPKEPSYVQIRQRHDSDM